MSKTKDLQRKAAGRTYRESLRAIVDTPPKIHDPMEIYGLPHDEVVKRLAEVGEWSLEVERKSYHIGELTADMNKLESECDGLRTEVELLQRRVAERDRAALIAAAQLDAETKRAEDAHGEAQRWALEVERLRELAYAPDGKEYRSMVFEESAKRLPLQEEAERLRLYVDAFRREEKRADDGGRIIDDLQAEVERLQAVIRAAVMAKTRLDDFADKANAGQIHYSARELKRKIGAAFAEFDSAHS